jgi:hypothetical protein
VQGAQRKKIQPRANKPRDRWNLSATQTHPTATAIMAADKARYYLEQSVPELHEYEKKNIFTKVRDIHSFDEAKS